MDLSPSALALVTGLIGGGSAVTAQVIAAVATSQRENKAAKVRRADARASAFADKKLDVFVRALGAIDKQVLKYDAYRASMDDAGTERSLPANVFDASAWEALAAEIDLLAPEVTGSINECMRKFKLLDFNVGVVGEAAYDEAREEIRLARAHLRNAMRVSMNVADPVRASRRARLKQWRDGRRTARVAGRPTTPS
ncbi:hypothetical protein ABFU82_22505 [Nocardioides sp. WV_118_6]